MTRPAAGAHERTTAPRPHLGGLLMPRPRHRRRALVWRDLIGRTGRLAVIGGGVITVVGLHPVYVPALIVGAVVIAVAIVIGALW